MKISFGFTFPLVMLFKTSRYITKPVERNRWLSIGLYMWLLVCFFLMATDVPGEEIIVDRILAVVNEDVITLNAVKDYIKIKHLVKEEDGYTNEITPELMDEYIKRRLVLQENKKIRLSQVNEGQIKDELKRLTDRIPEQELRVIGLDLSLVKGFLLEELIIREHTEKRLGFLVRIDEETIPEGVQEKNMGAMSASDILEIRETARKALFKKKLEEQKRLWLEELMEKANIMVNPH